MTATAANRGILQSARHGNTIFLSVVTLAELSLGVGLLRQKGATAKAAALQRWLIEIEAYHDGRLLPVDAKGCSTRRRVARPRKIVGHDPGLEDAIIAATADGQGLTVLTRNVADFTPMGVAVVNPFAAIPPDNAD